MQFTNNQKMWTTLRINNHAQGCKYDPITDTIITKANVIPDAVSIYDLILVDKSYCSVSRQQLDHYSVDA